MIESAKTLAQQGFVAFENAVPTDLITQARAEFHDAYLKASEELKAAEGADRQMPVVRVGHQRWMMTVTLQGAFADRNLYANPQVIETLKETLGDDFILESFGVVLSLPGSKPQHMHRDGPTLFNTGIDPMLPAHAVTVVIPLIEMNEHHGSTELWPGTHRLPNQSADQIKDVQAQTPITPLVREGSAVIWDYRLYHRGAGNLSDTPRPIIYITYSRHWFQDANNWKDGDPLSLGQGFLDQVPEDAKFLFRFQR